MGTCCCAQRSKFDFDLIAGGTAADGSDPLSSQQEEERQHIRLLNQLPTYENLIATYDCLLQSSDIPMPPPVPFSLLLNNNNNNNGANNNLSVMRASHAPSSTNGGGGQQLSQNLRVSDEGERSNNGQGGGGNDPSVSREGTILEKSQNNVMIVTTTPQHAPYEPIQLMEKLLPHRKERMFFMIINLLRMRPHIFME